MKILIISIIALLTTVLNAMPAPTNGSGIINSEIRGQLKGDEYLNWVETEKGEIIRYNKKNKRYEYLIEKDGNIKYSNVKYTNEAKAPKPKVRGYIIKKQPNINKEKLRNVWEKNKSHKFYNKY